MYKNLQNLRYILKLWMIVYKMKRAKLWDDSKSSNPLYWSNLLISYSNCVCFLFFTLFFVVIVSPQILQYCTVAKKDDSYLWILHDCILIFLSVYNFLIILNLDYFFSFLGKAFHLQTNVWRFCTAKFLFSPLYVGGHDF